MCYLNTLDPYNKVFSLLGLLPILTSVLPTTNYSKTLLDIFVEVTNSFIGYL